MTLLPSSSASARTETDVSRDCSPIFCSQHDETLMIRPWRNSEPFPSWLCLAKLQYMDGLGELTGAPRAAAELTKNFQLLSWAFARSPGARSRAWARLASFWDSGLFLPRYGIFA